MIKKPKSPKIPKMPKAPGASKPKSSIRAKSVWRLFKPLLWLTVLAIAAVLVYYFVPQVVMLGRFTLSLNFYCLLLIAAIAGILLLYVLIRLIGYFVVLARARKQEQMLGKAEVLRLQQRFETRWQSVEAALASTGVGLYEMPWYLILSSSATPAMPLLEAAGLTFPDLEHTRALDSDPRALDRWVFSNEAVFIDTTGSPSGDVENDTAKAEWEAMLNQLISHRRSCPLNGLLLLISSRELAEDSEPALREKAKQVLTRVQQIQNGLRVRLPLYLVVTQMNRIIGFTEFFSGMETEDVDQILGWSNPNPPEAQFAAHQFYQAFDDLSLKIKTRKWLQEGEYVAAASANRAALFADEFAALKAPLAAFIENLFIENRFAEPALLRGIYFAGDEGAGPLVTLHSKEYLSNPVLESLTLSAGSDTTHRTFFVKDLFVFILCEL